MGFITRMLSIEDNGCELIITGLEKGQCSLIVKEDDIQRSIILNDEDLIAIANWIKEELEKR